MPLKMFCFYILCFLLYEGHSADIDSTVNQYFSSETYKAFQKDWQKNKISYENAIKLALKDNYGYNGMNVFIRKSADTHKIANGFYMSDGVVGLMFHEMFLGELPHLSVPDVTFALASNVLRLKAGINRLLVYTRYSLYRNQSDVIYGDLDNKNSPFIYDLVENIGNVAIIAEDCMLTGYAITKLSGQTVDLGHSTFTVTDCKFSVEISSPGQGREPINANYFNHHQSKSLETLISKPIREELLPKLQATLLTYINTTLIFQDRLSTYRQAQHKVFKESSKYLLGFIRNLNKKSIQMNKAAMGLKPFDITWNVCVEKSCPIHIGINDAIVYGLDSSFSAHRGGPFKLHSSKIGEALSFNYIQVRGQVTFENQTIKMTHKFFAELDDVTFSIEIGINEQVQASNFVDWRSIELTIMNFDGNLEERLNVNSFINGYLYNEIPRALTEYLQRAGVSPKYDKLSNKDDGDYDYAMTSKSGELGSDKYNSSNYLSKNQYGTDQTDHEGTISKDKSLKGYESVKEMPKHLLLSLNKQNNGHVMTKENSEDRDDVELRSSYSE